MECVRLGAALDLVHLLKPFTSFKYTHPYPNASCYSGYGLLTWARFREMSMLRHCPKVSKAAPSRTHSIWLSVHAYILRRN